MRIKTSNRKILELLTLRICSNIERPNLRELVQQKIKIEKIKRRNLFISKGNMRVGRIASVSNFKIG